VTNKDILTLASNLVLRNGEWMGRRVGGWQGRRGKRIRNSERGRQEGSRGRGEGDRGSREWVKENGKKG
ncbi:MAG: hypothetical protein AAFO87_17930, partial [Cyanobacteria bacterium J06607_6]